MAAGAGLFRKDCERPETGGEAPGERSVRKRGMGGLTREEGLNEGKV